MNATETQARVASPDWDAGGRTHNWRNYVGSKTRKLWPTFTETQRVAIALDADEMAAQEEYE